MNINFVLRDISGVIPYRMANGMNAEKVSFLIENEFKKLSNMVACDESDFDSPPEFHVQVVFFEKDNYWGVMIADEGTVPDINQGFMTQIDFTEDVIRTIPWIWFEFKFFRTHDYLDDMIEKSK